MKLNLYKHFREMKNKTLNLSCLLLVFMFFLSCKNQEFKRHESGLKYKFIVKNKKTKLMQKGDIAVLIFRTFTLDNKMLEQSDVFRVQLENPSHSGGAIEDALAMMSEGDSAQFLINAKNYYNITRQQIVPKEINQNDDVRIDIKLVDVLSLADYKQEQKEEEKAAQRQEDNLLNNYLQQENIKETATLSGLYIVYEKKGTGKLPISGKKLTVHYSGYFVDGKLFDSSIERNEPFTFTFGIGQVIAGWDEGLAKTPEGSKIRLIIPSSLAYGAKQRGIIPPYSPLIFDIEVLTVEQ